MRAAQSPGSCSDITPSAPGGLSDGVGAADRGHDRTLQSRHALHRHDQPASGLSRAAYRGLFGVDPGGPLIHDNGTYRGLFSAAGPATIEEEMGFAQAWLSRIGRRGCAVNKGRKMTTQDLLDEEAELDYEAASRLHERAAGRLLSIPTDEDLVRELEQRKSEAPSTADRV